jgi:hypothetical protein
VDHDAAAPSRRTIQVTQTVPGYSIGALGSLVITVTRSPPTLASVRDFTAAIDAARREHPRGVSVVIAPRAPNPALGAAVTRLIVAEWKRLEPHLTCAAILFPASGLASALQRALASAVLAMRRGSAPVKSSANPFDVATFVARQDPGQGAPQLLGLAVQAFVSEHERPQGVG